MSDEVTYDENRPQRPSDVNNERTLKKIYSLSREDWEEIKLSFPNDSQYLPLIKLFEKNDNLPLHANEMALQINKEKWLSADTKRVSDSLKWYRSEIDGYFFRFIRIKSMTPYYVFVKIILLKIAD